MQWLAKYFVAVFVTAFKINNWLTACSSKLMGSTKTVDLAWRDVKMLLVKYQNVYGATLAWERHIRKTKLTEYWVLMHIYNKNGHFIYIFIVWLLTTCCQNICK